MMKLLVGGTMKRNKASISLKIIFLIISFSQIFFSCHKYVVTKSSTVYIMGRGRLSEEKMARFLVSKNNKIDYYFAKNFAREYIREASIEGVRSDVAFAQMCLKTAYLKFGGQVDASQNNFCGLGALDGGARGAFFKSVTLGVRAHIQHLKAYASTSKLKQKTDYPRFKYVKRGISPKLSGLTGRWASDKRYDLKIKSIMGKMMK